MTDCCGPAIASWERGVDPNGADSTAALQAIVDALPEEGGHILFKGILTISSLDLSGRRHVLLQGTGGSGIGPGASPTFRCDVIAGAIGSNASAINCFHTNNVWFKDFYFYQPDPLFDGTLLRYGRVGVVAGEDANFPCLDNVTLAMNSDIGVGLSLHGSTVGSFSRVNFAGGGTLVKLQDGDMTAVTFCNNHSFRNCNFGPRSQHPVVGCGDAIKFDGCNFQAGSSTGIGRAWVSSLSRPFRAVTFDCCTFYDQTAPGGEWLVGLWGTGFNARGNYFGGFAGSYAIDLGGGGMLSGDPQVRGVRGVAILGNTFEGHGVTFSGNKGDKTNVRGGLIAGNEFINTAPISSHSTTERVVFIGENTYDAPYALGGSFFDSNDMPTFVDRAGAVAAGLTTGQFFIAVGTGVSIVQVV